MQGLDEQRIVIDCGSDVIEPGSVRRVAGRGMPVQNTHPPQYGDLHVNFEVVFPRQLSVQQRASLAQILCPPVLLGTGSQRQTQRCVVFDARPASV